MRRLLLIAGILFFWAPNGAGCDAPTASGGAGPRIDVKFRAGTALDEPIRVLPSHLRKPVKRISPLITLSEQERDRIGAREMARWFRLELDPGTDVRDFLVRLRALDAVETAEQAPEHTPDPKPVKF